MYDKTFHTTYNVYQDVEGLVLMTSHHYIKPLASTIKQGHFSKHCNSVAPKRGYFEQQHR